MESVVLVFIIIILEDMLHGKQFKQKLVSKSQAAFCWLIWLLISWNHIKILDLDNGKLQNNINSVVTNKTLVFHYKTKLDCDNQHGELN